MAPQGAAEPQLGTTGLDIDCQEQETTAIYLSINYIFQRSINNWASFVCAENIACF